MGPDSTLITTRHRYWEVLHLSSKCFLVIRSRLLFWPLWIKKFKWCYNLYIFAETNFADQRSLMAVPVFRNISRSLIFAVREDSAKIMRLENLAQYGIPGNKETYRGTQANLIFN